MNHKGMRKKTPKQNREENKRTEVMAMMCVWPEQTSLAKEPRTHYIIKLVSWE